MSLEELGYKYKPTKMLHNYLEIFDKHFSNIRCKVKRILEIGVQTDRSVNMWRDYFPNAEIHGIDIDPKCSNYTSDRIYIHIGNQSDIKFLSTLPDNFDIIIDDGSHIEQHVITSLQYLFPNKLSKNGIYVIEDMLQSSGLLQKIEPIHTNNTYNKYMLEFIDGINYCPPGYKDPWCKLNHFNSNNFKIKDVIGIHFYRFLTIIDKGQNPEDGDAKIRIKEPNLVKSLELEIYGKLLNKWD